MGRKKLRYSFYIVCEGTKTEPFYFDGLKKYITNNNIWGDDTHITINISPEPAVEEEEQRKKTISKHKTKRKRRKLNQPIRQNEELIENEYKALPTRFVREAQFQLMEEVHDEVWVVFDHDNHPDHSKAFSLAKQIIKNKHVNIAFSSIAFEHWILLHYEKNSTPFKKSECRDGKLVLKCGSGVNNNDCYGGSCIGGHLRVMEYLPLNGTTKKGSIFPLLAPYIKFACINASWLRHKQDYSIAQIYNLNPYTDVDILVLRLLNSPYSFKWLKLQETFDNDNGTTIFFSNSNDTFQCVVQTNNTIIFPKGAFTIQNKEHKIIAKSINRTVIKGKSTHFFTFKNIKKYTSCFLSLDIITYIEEIFIEIE